MQYLLPSTNSLPSVFTNSPSTTIQSMIMITHRHTCTWVRHHVLWRLCKTTSTRKKVLAKQYVVLAPSLDSSGSWRNALLEWFRTQVVVETPDHHAEVLFSSATHAGNLKMGIFSAGDIDFYPHLVDFIGKCESRTGLVAEVPSVQDGTHQYMSKLNPPIVANESSYDKKSANSQWASQNPFGIHLFCWRYKFLASRRLYRKMRKQNWPCHRGS